MCSISLMNDWIQKEAVDLKERLHHLSNAVADYVSRIHDVEQL